MYFQYTIVLTIIVHMFRVSITHHQELFYEQSLKLRVASQYALKNWMFYTIVKYTCYNTS
jgi:hypothetical protein